MGRLGNCRGNPYDSDTGAKPGTSGKLSRSATLGAIVRNTSTAMPFIAFRLFPRGSDSSVENGIGGPSRDTLSRGNLVAVGVFLGLPNQTDAEDLVLAVDWGERQQHVPFLDSAPVRDRSWEVVRLSADVGVGLIGRIESWWKTSQNLRLANRASALVSGGKSYIHSSRSSSRSRRSRTTFAVHSS